MLTKAVFNVQLGRAPMRVTKKMYRENVAGQYRSFVDTLLTETKHNRNWDELAELEGTYDRRSRSRGALDLKRRLL